MADSTVIGHSAADKVMLFGGFPLVGLARSKAFEDGDKGKADLRELRDEVAKLGYTVKDREKKQYWRATRPAGG
ncbi:hypothetical protein EV646_112116 [Kribbella antiqua]|uniref:Cysteinyl-tRNA ligase anticodon binding domain-containing protein n=1 Tax=Kribbella antiqua TaxID=2512217 RepID=A0A4V2S3A2_9ACTN|nr:hypothetical protein [Kribbella antiqua]TCO43540.1 hypothetical protein EV646_112116 [Kribbella antiqua]